MPTSPSPLETARETGAVLSEHESYAPLLEQLGVTREEVIAAASERLVELIASTFGGDPWERLVAVWADGFVLGARNQRAKGESNG